MSEMKSKNSQHFSKADAVLTVLQEISTKLDTLIAVTAAQNKERDDQITILVSLGYSNKQISEFTGIPKGTVDTVRANLKK